MQAKMLLFDLDGTLLRSDKTISPRTLRALERCRGRGLRTAVVTSRSAQNARSFLERLAPDALISSGGALACVGEETVFRAEFPAETVRALIGAAREVCGPGVEMTADTLQGHYWNYRVDPRKADASWGESIYTDFVRFELPVLKFCVETGEEEAAELARRFPESDCARFSDGGWVKFTPRTATKENAIRTLCAAMGISEKETIAFGDDWADIGMLRLCGLGVAMGNAIAPVRAAAQAVIGSNDADGIAVFLEERFLR